MEIHEFNAAAIRKLMQEAIDQAEWNKWKNYFLKTIINDVEDAAKKKLSEIEIHFRRMFVDESSQNPETFRESNECKFYTEIDNILTEKGFESLVIIPFFNLAGEDTIIINLKW